MLKPLLAWWRGEQHGGEEKALKDSGDQGQAKGKVVDEVGSQSDVAGTSVR